MSSDFSYEYHRNNLEQKHILIGELLRQKILSNFVISTVGVLSIILCGTRIVEGVIEGTTWIVVLFGVLCVLNIWYVVDNVKRIMMYKKDLKEEQESYVKVLDALNRACTDDETDI